MQDLESKLFFVGDLLVDVGQQRVTRAGIEITLPNLSFQLLVALIRAAPDVLGNDSLMAQVWPGLVINPETINKRVNLLRDALGDSTQEPRYIAGVRGRGYRLIAPTTATTAASRQPVLPSQLAQTRQEPAGPSLPSTAAAANQRTWPWLPRQSWHWLALSIVMVGVVMFAAISVRRAAHKPDSVAVHRVDATALPTAALETRSRTVAVLPFENISPDVGDAYLALGLPEMILNRLSRINGLSVIARTSSFALTTGKVDSREIGRRLNSGYLVSGSVQRMGDRLRVAVQLVDSFASTQIWSAHYDRALRDIFSVEDEIADQVAEALATRLGNLQTVAGTKETSNSLEAYLSFLRGRSLLGRFTIAESNAAVPYFQKAIALDPHFASAYASLYESRMQAASVSGDFLPPLRRQYQWLIDRALAIDSRSGAAYFARAIWGDDSSEKAQGQRLADFQRGLALDPSNGRGLTAYADFLITDLDRYEEGMLILQSALRIDPMSPRAHFLAAVKSSKGAGPEVIEQKMLEVLELDPNFVPALQRYAKLHWFFRGALAEAVHITERAVALDPANPQLRNLAMAIYLDLDDVPAARDVAAGTVKSAAAARLLLSLHAGDWRSAGLAATDKVGWEVGGGFENWGAGEALRDYAFKSGELNHGIVLMQANYGLHREAWSDLGLFNFRQAVYLSQLLAAQGQVQQALELRHAAAAWNDANEAKFGHVYARRTRAAILLLDGKTDAALAELAESFRSKDYVQWWYTIEYDPLWLPLHGDRRFQAIAETCGAMSMRSAANLRRCVGAARSRGAEAPQLRNRRG